MGGHPIAFVLIRETIGEFHFRVPAQQGRAFACQSCLDPGADGPDPGNGGNAQCQAGQKDAESAQSPTQFPAGETGSKAQAHSAASAI